VVLDFLVSHEPTVHLRPDSLTLAGDYIRARTWKLFLTGVYNDLAIGSKVLDGYALQALETME